MSFFDEYEDLSGGGEWMKAPEKEVLIQNGIPVEIKAVIDDATNTYQGAPMPRYVAVALVPNPENGEGEERKIGFPQGTVESRDRMLAQMAEYLQREDAEPVIVKIARVGRSIVLQQA